MGLQQSLSSSGCGSWGWAKKGSTLGMAINTVCAGSRHQAQPSWAFQRWPVSTLLILHRAVNQSGTALDPFGELMCTKHSIRTKHHCLHRSSPLQLSYSLERREEITPDRLATCFILRWAKHDLEGRRQSPVTTTPSDSASSTQWALAWPPNSYSSTLVTVQLKFSPSDWVPMGPSPVQKMLWGSPHSH